MVTVALTPKQISIHAPREGSDWARPTTMTSTSPISIHAPREGSDARKGPGSVEYSIFLSTLPARGATASQFFGFDVNQISIHAPREGSDSRLCRQPRRRQNFYPRSPRGERPGAIHEGVNEAYFYPRSPRGERRHYSMDAQDTVPYISIHAPREGSDSSGEVTETPVYVFLSTLPARGATHRFLALNGHSSNFYPRSPRGERQILPLLRGQDGGFLSTLPARGATWRAAIMRCWILYFYPRSPRGERLIQVQRAPHPVVFLSTLPARGATKDRRRFPGGAAISIHAPREGSDLQRSKIMFTFCLISIHAPREGSDL